MISEKEGEREHSLMFKNRMDLLRGSRTNHHLICYLCNISKIDS